MGSLEAVIVLNAGYEFMGLVSWQRAMAMLCTGKVEVVKESDRTVRTVSRTFRVPAVIRLLKFIRQIYRREVPFSRKNILVRDSCVCQYCGGEHSTGELTIDHIIPKVQGGSNEWTNVVTCCRSCNMKKGGADTETGRYAPHPQALQAHHHGVPESVSEEKIRNGTIGNSSVLERGTARCPQPIQRMVPLRRWGRKSASVPTTGSTSRRNGQPEKGDTPHTHCREHFFIDTVLWCDMRGRTSQHTFPSQWNTRKRPFRCRFRASGASQWLRSPHHVVHDNEVFVSMGSMDVQPSDARSPRPASDGVLNIIRESLSRYF